MIVCGPSITTMRSEMIAFILEILIGKTEIIVSALQIIAPALPIIVSVAEVIISREPSGTRSFAGF